MKIVFNIIAVLLLLVGAVWILQGMSIIGGSVMSGQSQWTLIGGIVLLVGIVVLFFTNRKRASSPKKSS